MRTCPTCKGMLVKYGFLKKERTQRYRCKMCKKMCSDADKRLFGTLRSKPDKILTVVSLLSEGMGIRSASRVTGIHRDTVLRILKHAGKRCHDRMNKQFKDVSVKRLQADETWTYVQKKANKEIDPNLDLNPWGDFYIFLGLDADTKLMLMPTIGKRSELATERFANDIAKSTTGRFQLTTDGFRPYKDKMKAAFGDRIDFAQILKERHMTNKLAKIKKQVNFIRSGNPDKKFITTAHVERVNLTLRTWNKRFGRKTICFSKDEENLAYSVYLFAGHYNFCKAHGGIVLKKTTPAMMAGVSETKLTISELISHV